MSSADPISDFEKQVEYHVTSELRAMLRTAQDWIDQADDGVFVQYREIILDELETREVELKRGEFQ